MPTEPTMDDVHEAKLKNILRLPEAIAIPDAIVAAYWRFKRAADRLGGPVTDSDLVWMVVHNGGFVPPSPPPDFSAYCESVKHGDVVEARWRFGKWKRGWYHGRLPNGSFMVQLDDETGEDREFAPNAVRLATDQETPANG